MNVIQQLTNVPTIMKNWENNRTEEIALVPLAATVSARFRSIIRYLCLQATEHLSCDDRIWWNSIIRFQNALFFFLQTFLSRYMMLYDCTRWNQDVCKDWYTSSKFPNVKATRATGLFHCPTRLLIKRSRDVSKLRDWSFECLFSYDLIGGLTKMIPDRVLNFTTFDKL